MELHILDAIPDAWAAVTGKKAMLNRINEWIYETDRSLLRWECRNFRYLIAAYVAIVAISTLGFVLSPDLQPMPYESFDLHILWATFGLGPGRTITLLVTQLTICWYALRFIRFIAGAALAAAHHDRR